MNFLLETAVCLSMPPENLCRPFVSRMAASGLTSEAQLRYLLQWFGEFSELQREDFLPVLAAARGEKPDQLAATLAALSCEDKPVSLFQCRIKLFNEWYPAWTQEEQDRLVKGVSEIDSQFGEKLQEYLLNGPPVNGTNGFLEDVLPNEDPKTEEEPDEELANNIQESPVGIDQGIPQENIPVEIVAAS